MGELFVTGKVILLGEHAVLYGAPAVSLPLQKGLHASFVATPASLEVGGSVGAEELPLARIQTILGKLPGFQGMRLFLRSEIPPMAGFGASAALSVVLVRAGAALCPEPVPDALQLALVAELEGLFHGTPSGIDHTTVWYGQPLLLQRPKRCVSLPFSTTPLSDTMALLDLPPLPLLVGYSGEHGRTRDLVIRVREQLAGPSGEQAFAREMEQLLLRFFESWEAEDGPAMGRIFSSAQALYNQLGLNTRGLDRMITLALEAGAWGAKLSGAGGGGACLALAPVEVLPRVRAAWEEAGFSLLSQLL